MLKGFILLFHASAFLLHGVLPTSVSISQRAPTSAQTNTSFMVQITINKAAAEGSGKFTEQLPVGFSAVPIDQEGAKVNFNNNAIQFSWDTLPSDGSSLNISFRVDVSTLASATRDTLLGKFTYTSYKQNLEAACPPSYISISASSSAVGTTPSPQHSNDAAPVAVTPTPAPTPNNNVTPAAVTPTSTPPPGDYTTPVAATTPAPMPNSNNVKSGPAGVFVERRFPSAFMEPISTAKITLIIHKLNITGFAKVEDSIPFGFIANSMDTHGASFTFDDNIAKFVWQNMPADSVITVSYQLSSGTDVKGKYSLHGDLSYIYNNEPIALPIGATTFSTPSNNTNATSTDATPSSTKPTSSPVVNNSNNELPTIVNTTNQPTTTIPPIVTPATAPAAVVAASSAPATTAVIYKVQIMALHNAVDVSYFSSKKQIKAKISTEVIGDYTKYTVGPYTDYKSAQQALEAIKNGGISGPFIVAYKAGERISVQQARALTHE